LLHCFGAGVGFFDEHFGAQMGAVTEKRTSLSTK